MVIPSIRSVGDATDPRNSRSSPMAVMLRKMSFRLPAIVISCTGKRQLSILDPQSRSAARIVAGHHVHAHAHQLGHIEPALEYRRRSALGVCCPFSRNRLPAPMPGLPASPREALPVECMLSLRAGVRIQQVVLENAVFYDHRAPRRQALAIKRRRAESAHQRSVINHRYVFGGHLFAQQPGEERSAAIDGIAIRRFEDMADQRTRNLLREHDRNPLRRTPAAHSIGAVCVVPLQRRSTPANPAC